MKLVSILLPMLAVACAVTPPASSESATCQRTLQTAERAASALAEQRIEQMKVMRFASEEAMNAYMAETDRISAEAIRMVVLLNDVGRRYGFADHNPDPVADLTDAAVSDLIDAGDICAFLLLQ